MMNQPGNLRKHPRVDKLCFTIIKSFDERGESNVSHYGRTLNLSEGGMLLDVSRGVPFVINVNVSLGLGDDVVNIKGEVVHLRKNEVGDTELGIKFVDTPEDQLELIRSIL